MKGRPFPTGRRLWKEEQMLPTGLSWGPVTVMENVEEIKALVEELKIMLEEQKESE